jgi:DNA-binding beta-propeller fold protein YncE
VARWRWTFALLLVLLMSPAAAAASGSVYVSAWNAQKIDEFRAGANGALTSIGSIDAGDSQPWYLAMTSDAKNLYATTFSGRDVVAFDVGAGGALVAKDASHGGITHTGTSPVDIAVSPDDKNAYVANYGSASVSIYDIAADGSISAHNPDSVAAGLGPYGVAVSPDGTSVYVANANGLGTISQYDRAADGSLTPKTPDTVSVGKISSNPGPDYLVLTPDGKHLYSANYNDSSVGIFDVAANGTLTEQSGSPVASGYGLYEIAITPDGQTLYAPSEDDGKVYEYTIGASGGLTPKSTPSITGGISLGGIWPSPDGRSAYAVDEGTYVGPTSNKNYALAQFDIGSGGALAAKSPATLPTDDYPAGAIVTPDQGPTATFSATPGAGLAVSFDATGSVDPDGGTIVRYLWNFGDGSAAVEGGPRISHTYASKGSYTVSLTLTDDAGCSTAKTYTGHTAFCGGGRSATTQVANPGSGGTPPPGGGTPPPAGCVANRLILTDVFPGGGRTRLLGVAPKSARGKTVVIKSTWNGKSVAKAKVQPDLSFTASAPLPPRALRSTNRARYIATLGKVKSQALKFHRRLYTTAISRSGQALVFSGAVVKPLAKPPAPVVIRASAACSTIARGAVVATVKPKKSGAFTARISLPPALQNAATVFLRAQTKVRANTKTKKTSATFSLIRGVKLK